MVAAAESDSGVEATLRVVTCYSLVGEVPSAEHNDCQVCLPETGSDCGCNGCYRETVVGPYSSDWQVVGSVVVGIAS